VPSAIDRTHLLDVNVQQSVVGCVVTTVHGFEGCFCSTEVARLSVGLDRALRGSRVVDRDFFQSISSCLLGSQLGHNLSCV
jgi:hypothetical protein